ncbi:hypothetical protein [Thermoactinomyces sp. DSM 45892]|nr:hypothetical protein [Thermoactinomyces sp. DSM 45892]
MEMILLHLIAIPGIFLLGRLSSSVRMTGFNAKSVKVKKSSDDNS